MDMDVYDKLARAELVELFCGTARLTKTAEEEGMQAVGGDAPWSRGTHSGAQCSRTCDGE